jgi:hypothetical protein
MLQQQRSHLNGRKRDHRQVHCQSQSQIYVTTYGQSISLAWCQAPTGDLRQDSFSLTIAGLLMWGALYDEMTGLSFTRRVYRSIASNGRPSVVACSYFAGLFTEPLPRNGSMRQNNNKSSNNLLMKKKLSD